jgi:hypothetical protein
MVMGTENLLCQVLYLVFMDINLFNPQNEFLRKVPFI